MPGPWGFSGPRGFLTDEEKQHMPKVTKELLLRILSYLKPYWLQFGLVFVTILLSAAVGLLPSIITGRIVDEALIGENMRLLIQLLLMAFVTLAVSQVVGVLESYINAWISQRIIFDMKNQMYDHLLLSMSWKLALVGIVVIPLLILPTKSVCRTRWKLLTESQEKADEMNQLVNETLSVSGSVLVKLFAREQKEYERFVGVNEEVTRLAMKEQRSGKWFRVIMGMFTQVGPLLIYFAGGYFIISRADPNLTVGTITATVALINRLYRPVQSLLDIEVDFTRSLALFTRIFDYFDMVNTITSPPDGKKPAVAQQDIKFDHVAFSYDPSIPLLTDIDFTVPGGQMYAIVGPSGSGKSTVVNLIPRLYDVLAGSVSIAGVDVRDFDLSYLRGCIGVVTQDSYLFNGTIRENLLYAKEDATQAELEEACKTANIHDFIVNQPDGYDTQVGNRGLKLSGGEKQRLSIARVILKDPKILILGQDQHRHRPSALADPQGGSDPGAQERHHCRTGHPRGAAEARRHLPGAVRDPVPHRPRHGSGKIKTITDGFCLRSDKNRPLFFSKEPSDTGSTGAQSPHFFSSSSLASSFSSGMKALLTRFIRITTARSTACISS